ncbi:MAG TPA: glycosyltransferase family 39 protein [Candidatus Nanoarchaeia archaeon]|nr:glycosyltransferase family 39 protein [Candidatus Nanoarchaeia archaeon]
MDAAQSRKQKLWSLLKNKQVWVIAAILVFAFILRYVVAISNEPPAQWWDSGDYLTGAKEIWNIAEYDTYTLSPRRPFFLSVLWGFFLKLGGDDTILLFVSVLFSLAVVWLTYKIAKTLFSQEVAWISAILSAVFWQYIFHTTRLLTDIPSLAFMLASLYFFWQGYGEERSKKDLIFAGLFFGLAWFTRAASLIYIVPLFAVVLVKDRWKFVLNKKLWLMVLVAVIAISPFIIWLFAEFENPVQKFTGIGGTEQRFAGRGQLKYLWENLDHIANDVFSPAIAGKFFSARFLGFLAILGVFFLSSSLFFGFDVMWKTKSKELLKRWFLLVWLLTPYVFYSLTGAGVEDRYLFGMFPVLFMAFGEALVRLKNAIKQNKAIAYAIIVLILLAIGYFQVDVGISSAKSARYGFAEIAYAGAWIKANSDSDDAVITSSKYQNMYYSERNTYPFVEKAEDRENASSFIPYLEKINPKFVVVSVYEPAFTPPWAYAFPQEHPELFQPMQAYYDSSNNPRLVIYGYMKHPAFQQANKTNS